MIRFVALALLTGAAIWEQVRPGVWQRESRMASAGALAPVRAVAVRIDPRRVAFSLGPLEHGRPWTIDSVGSLDAVAFNAGQFRTSGSWGWVVREGVEMQAPGSGSVAMAFVVDSSGVPSLVEQSEVSARRMGIAVSIVGRMERLPHASARIASAPGAGTRVLLEWRPTA